MKILDKIKDLFTDEEEVVETAEVEIEKTVEHKLPTFMRKKIEQEEERIKEEKLEENDLISDKDIVKTNTNFSFPVEFNDSDFEVEGYSNQNVLAKEREKTVSELYTKKDEPKPLRFRPTPIISPVYGVLDKNYQKDEILEKDENGYDIKRPSKKVDFESVRKKAFGTLADDLKDNLCENCEYLKEVKITKKVEKIPEDNLLYDIVKDEEKKEDITVEEAADNYYDFGVAYEPKHETVITDTSDIKIVDHNGEEVTGEKIEVKEPEEKPTLEEGILEELDKSQEEDVVLEKENKKTKAKKKENEEIDKDLDLSDDIFNLIDSMYDEGDE